MLCNCKSLSKVALTAGIVEHHDVIYGNVASPLPGNCCLNQNLRKSEHEYMMSRVNSSPEQTNLMPSELNCRSNFLKRRTFVNSAATVSAFGDTCINYKQPHHYIIAHLLTQWEKWEKDRSIKNKERWMSFFFFFCLASRAERNNSFIRKHTMWRLNHELHSRFRVQAAVKP